MRHFVRLTFHPGNGSFEMRLGGIFLRYFCIKFGSACKVKFSNISLGLDRFGYVNEFENSDEKSQNFSNEEMTVG